MKIPFQRAFDEPRLAYIENAREEGVYFPLPIQVFNFVGAEESELVQAVNLDSGLSSLPVGQKIDEIAEIAALHNGGDKSVISGFLVQLRDRHPYIEDREKHLGLLASKCPREFQQFMDLVGDDGFAMRMRQAAEVHAMLNRIPAQETSFGKWNPLEWQTKDALNPKEIHPGFVTAFHNFYVTEDSGVSTRYLTTEIVDGKEAQVYKWVKDEVLEDRKKAKEPTKDEIAARQKEDKKRATVIAGKS